MCDVSRKDGSRGKESRLVGGRWLRRREWGWGRGETLSGYKVPLVGNNKHVVEVAKGSGKTAL